MKVTNSKRLGEIALEEGSVSTSQLEACLSAQRIIADVGCPKPLGEVMVDKRCISREERDRLLRIQRARYQVRALGDFVLGTKLGQGGMASVFRAVRTSDGATVALKFLSKELHGRSGYLERFAREARLAASMAHPHLVRAFGAEVIDGRHVLVLEYVEGRTLSRTIADQGALPESAALRVTGQVARALAYVHANGIVHRDVKPSNVMIDAAGNAKLIDLGLARHAEAEGHTEITVTGQIIGTPDFIAPEQILGRPTDGRSDVYSLGATLYMTVTAQAPYAQRGDPQAVLRGHLAGVYRDPRELRPGLSAGVARIIAKAMATEPEQRYPSMDAFAEDIEELRTCGAPTRGGPTPAPVAPHVACEVCGAATRPGSTRCSRCVDAIEHPPATLVARLASPARRDPLQRSRARVGEHAPLNSDHTSVESAPTLSPPRERRGARSDAGQVGMVAVAAMVAVGIAIPIAFHVASRATPAGPSYSPDPSPTTIPDVPTPRLPGPIDRPTPAPTPPIAPSLTYDAHMALASRQLRTGDAASALASIDAAARLRDLDAPAFTLRGEVNLALGQPSQARLALTRATSLDPHSWPAWALLGKTHLMAGDREAAMAAFERALAAHPPGDEAHRLRAQVAALALLVNPDREDHRPAPPAPVKPRAPDQPTEDPHPNRPVEPAGIFARRANRTGGTPAGNRAVDLALEWLAQHQDEDGKWDADGFMKHDPPGDVCDGASKMTWVDPGATGLAVLAFLGAGHTHCDGSFKENVKRGVEYLLRVQMATGLIGGKRGHYMYNHAICALALAEAYGMTKSPLVKGGAQKAIEYLIAARNPGVAWRYGERDGDNDLSVTGWCHSALACARNADLGTDGLDGAEEETLQWIESITNLGGITGYRQGPPRNWEGPTSSRFQNDELGVNTSVTHSANHTPTAIAMVCRALTSNQRDDPRLAAPASWLLKAPPQWSTDGNGQLSRIDFYYWYYGCLALYLTRSDAWPQWSRSAVNALVDHQQPSGAARGSWDPIDAWGFGGGRVYATAINALTLETPYRFAQIASK